MASTFTAALVLTGNLVVAITANASESGASCPGHLLSLDSQGQVIRGTMAALREAVTSGSAIRVGFELDFDADGSTDISHWAQASFLTAFRDHLYAQIPAIARQVPDLDGGALHLASNQQWTGLLGTTGVLEGTFSGSDQVQRHVVNSTWCLDEPAPSPPSQCAQGWHLALDHDAEGAVLAGSRAALKRAVRSGLPIRLAWGVAVPARSLAVEHSAPAVFVSIASDNEVFAQLPEHIAQSSYAVPEQSRFDSGAVMWRGLMGSDGSFDAIWVDRGTGEVVRRLPQRARIAWFYQAVCPAPAPRDLMRPGGVVAAMPVEGK